jgi:Protein of unknown function (DUF2541)
MTNDLSRRATLLSGASALLVLAAPASAAEVVVLGERTVNLGTDRDVIHVGLLDGLFSRIKLQVEGNSIFIQSLRVQFVNEEIHEVPVGSMLLEGRETRWFFLPGLARAIRFVELSYRRVPLGGKARVTVLGRKL